MKRSSDSDSEEDVRDDTERRLSSLVLRPAITSLPSIDDDHDSDGDDSSTEAELLFSNINWSTEESTGFPLDLELASPRAGRPAPVSDSRTVVVAPGQPSPAAAPLLTGRAAPEADVASATTHGSTAVPTGVGDGASHGNNSNAAMELASATLHDPVEPYEGQGWLAGAAGRLANNVDRRRVKGADASDAEHVAAAARDAAALQLLLLQQREQQYQKGQQHQQQPRQHSGPGEPMHMAAAGPYATVSYSGNTNPDGGRMEVALGGHPDVDGALQRRLQVEREEQEQRIAKDFHDAVRAAEAEPPLRAEGGLSLEATVAGLGMDDLDALIARLSAGTIDMAGSYASGGSLAAAEDSSGKGASTSAGPFAPGALTGSGLLWPLDLPAAESLWSDEEEVVAEEPAQAVAQAAAPGLSPGQGLAGPPGQELELAGPTSGPTGPSVAAAPPMSASVAAAAGAAPSPLAMPGPMPAKFKFFAGPASVPMPAGAHPPPAIPPLHGTGAASSGSGNVSGGSVGSGGPIIVDLRASIAEAVQRSGRELAAAAAQRESQAKAAAARRRLVSESDSEGDDKEEDETEAAARVAVRRPVTPAPSAGPKAAPIPAPLPASTATAPTATSTSALPAASPTTTPAPQTAARRARGITDSAVTSVSANTMRPPEPEPAQRSTGGIGKCNANGGATAVPAASKPSTSVGTDSADLRPPTRSTFVCTTERQDEEEERARDIREYLKARAAAAEAAAKPAAAVLQEQRRWPEPPPEVAQRIAGLAAERPTAAFGGTTTLSRGPADSEGAAVSRPARVVATHAGGDDQEVTGPLGNGITASIDGVACIAACVGDESGSDEVAVEGGKAAVPSVSAMTAASTSSGAATADTGVASSQDGSSAGRAFAACSTEGDEELVAPPPPSSVIDARRERGSRMAAAGTVITLRSTPTDHDASTAGMGKSTAAQTASLVPGDSSAASQTSAAPIERAPKETSRSPTLAVRSAPDPAPQTTTAAPMAPPQPTGPPSGSIKPPPLLQQVAATAPAVAPPSLPRLSPQQQATAVLQPAQLVVSPASAAAAVPAAPCDLCRLPAWLPASSCFTLLVTSPSNMSTLEAGRTLAWLLQTASLPATSASRATLLPSGAPPFTIVGVRLLGVDPSWKLLPAAAATHFRLATGASGGGGGGSGAGSSTGSSHGVVRVLALACVPRPGLDPDSYSHELPASAAVDAAAAASAAQQLESALAGAPWSVGQATSTSPHSSTMSPPQQAQAKPHAAPAWVSAVPGAELLFGPLRLPPHAFSHHQSRASASGALSPSSPATSAAGQLDAAAALSGQRPGPGQASIGPATTSTFVCVVSRGVLQHSELLSGLLYRAARMGLTLAGLQVVYATEEAAAAIVAATPHRPLPYTGAAVLALAGRNEALRRWAAQLGPPDARLAVRTDPGSLHALYGDAARQITCSYDASTAAREVSVLFQGGTSDLARAPQAAAGAAAAGRPPPQQLRGSPRAGAQSSGIVESNGGAAEPAVAETSAPVSGLASSGPAQPRWVALPAGGAVQLSRALWAVQQLLWCGFNLQGLLLTCLPAAPVLSEREQQQLQQQQGAQVSHGGVHLVLGAPMLVLQLSKEEAAEELPLMLSSLPQPPPTALPAGSSSAGADAPQLPDPPALLAVPSLLPSDLLATHLHPADVQALPQPHVAEQLLAAVAGPDVLGLSTAAVGLSPSAPLAMPYQHQHHGEDGLVVVALQARPLHAAALLLAAAAMHATVAEPPVQPHHGQHPLQAHEHCYHHQREAQLHLRAHERAGAAAAGSASTGGGGGLELVACRYLRQVPSDVANCLAVLQPPPQAHGSGAAAAGGGSSSGSGMRPVQRLVISQPALVAVFHGPDAQARMAGLLTTALQRLHLHGGGLAPEGLPHGDAAGDTRDDTDGAAWAALVEGLLRDYPTVVPTAAGAVPPLAAISVSQAAAKRALAHAFSPGHIFLDAAIHDGIHRPPLPEGVPQAPLPGSAAETAATPMCRLLAGPERLPAVVALDFAALHRNLLPRLIKQLVREGYTVNAATTGVLQPDGAAAAALSGLSGRPAVLLHVSRSNAVAHLRSLAAALAAVGAAAHAPGGGGASSPGLYTCGTWREVVAVVQEVWPQGGACGAAAGSGALSAGSGVKPRRFVRPEGSRLLQLTAMVVTPSLAPEGGGAPCLEWLRLADALDALHAEGFRLAAVRASLVTPRDLAELSRASYRVSPAQQQAIHATASGSAAAYPPLDVTPGAVPPPAPPASNLVLLALARDNAVTSLQILMDEAGRAAAAGRQGSGPGHTLAAAGNRLVSPAALGPGSLGRREAVAALAAVADCVSVSHSPAAAEQQVTAAFQGAFGAGDVPLVQ